MWRLGPPPPHPPPPPLGARGENTARPNNPAPRGTEADPRLEPDDIDSYNSRGVALCLQNAYAQAVADFSEAIQRAPRAARGWFNRGKAYAAQGLFDQALADYDEAIRLRPQDARTYYHRGR